MEWFTVISMTFLLVNWADTGEKGLDIPTRETKLAVARPSRRFSFWVLEEVMKFQRSSTVYISGYPVEIILNTRFFVQSEKNCVKSWLSLHGWIVSLASSVSLSINPLNIRAYLSLSICVPNIHTCCCLSPCVASFNFFKPLTSIVLRFYASTWAMVVKCTVAASVRCSFPLFPGSVAANAEILRGMIYSSDSSVNKPAIQSPAIVRRPQARVNWRGWVCQTGNPAV